MNNLIKHLSPEQHEIIMNAIAAHQRYRRGEPDGIDDEQLNGVFRMIEQDITEKELQGKYPETENV